MGREQLPNRSPDGDVNRRDGVPAEILERLRPRERDVLVAFVAEPNVKRIAKDLGLSPNTVVNYLTTIQQHMRVSSQAELMKLILTHPPPSPPRSPATELGDFHIRKSPQLVDGVRVRFVHSE